MPAICQHKLPHNKIYRKPVEEEDEVDGSGRLFVNGSADHSLSVEDAVTVGSLILDTLRRKQEEMFPG